MRTRAYRPDVSCRLEGRQLLSGVTGRPADPYVFSSNQSKLVVSIVARSFTVYARNHDRILLPRDLDDVIAIIPFSRADGLPSKFDDIVNEMLHDIHADVPHAIRTAANEVIAVTRAELEARVQAGDVVVR